ncbi:MAG: response regulator [Candidatus Aminicenantes bacterium]|nr:response regulator [Candidatus Aminicenantes bacterium]
MADKKILIVDYDSSSLDSLAKIFDPYEFEIIKATNGMSAYDMFQSEKPDLVILEAMLPKLHGFDLAKKISNESKGKVPVIIVTGLYRGPVYRNEALNYLGASEYFEKPYDEAQLIKSALNLLKEEEEIQEELPDSDAILEGLSKRFKNSFKDIKVEEPAEKKQEAELPSKEPQKEEVPKEKKEAVPPKDEKKSPDSGKKAKPEIDEDIIDEISSLLDEKKKKKE